MTPDSANPPWRAALLATAALLIAALALLVILDRDRQPAFVGGAGAEPRLFTLTPRGDAVQPLTPIRVTFERPPVEKDGAALLTLDPPVQGQYLWQSQRTLVFQPDFPGLLRGVRYTVRVPERPEAGLERDVQQTFTTDGRLEVVNVIPAADDVEVPREFQVLVQFSRSVAPLTTLAARPEDAVISFDPPLPGKGEWLNTSLYRFVPQPGAVRPNTRYQLSIAAGLSSAADGVLAQDYSWSFTTFGPALDSVTPDRNTRFVGPQQDVRLRFNQALNRAALENAFRLLDPGGQPVAGTFAWSDGDTVVSFRPAQPLGRLLRYEVVVPAGIAGANGGATRVEWRSTFETVGLPRVVSTTPADGSEAAERFGIQIVFSNPMDEDSLEGKISVSGVNPEEMSQSLAPDETRLFLNARLESSTAYRVSIAEGAVDRYGQPLPAFSFGFSTGARPPQITLAIPHEVATYSAATEPVLYYHATNSQEANFTLYPLTADEMRGIQERNFIERDPRNPFTPSQPPLATWSEDVSGARDEVLLRSTSLSRNGGPLPEGDYLVRIGTPSPTSFRSEMAFSVVDTAIVTKLSYGELLVWALDLQTGRPVSNLSLRASGDGLTAGDTARTDANGIASFPVATDVEAFFRQRQYLVRVESDGRWGAGSTNWQQGLTNFEEALPREFYPRQYAGHVYTDRPIYRAGEEVFYKGVVRADDDAVYSVPQKLDGLWFVVRDSEGKELVRQAVQVNEFGSFAGSIELAEDAATGDYGMTIEWQAEARFNLPITGTSFLVAEFRRPEFEVQVQAGRPDYVNGETIDVAVDATYFFGGGVEGAEAQWSVQSSPAPPNFEGYERYSFSDFDYYARPSLAREPAEQAGSSITDSRGTARFSLPATLSGDQGTRLYQISATVLDQSAQAVAGSTSVFVHPAALHAGIRPAEYLASAGSEARIELVSVDVDGNAVANRPVSVNVYQRTWITTKEQTPDGARRYRSEPRDTLLTTLAATTGADGRASVAYTPTASGTLRLVAEIRDDAGRVARSAAYLWVSGGGRASWQITNDDSLTLVADKDLYQVGETAQVLVPAPFEGAIGLVTVERGKIIDRNVRSFATNAERLSIPIVDRSVPDVFAGVVLYRPPTNEDPIPRFKVGYVQLNVSTDTRLLNVSVKPDRAQAAPGETVRYDVKVTDSQGRGVRAELSAALVDKAVLSLAQERGPNGLRAFWFERGLGVSTASSLTVSVDRANDVISAASAGGKGGGGLDDDRIRQDFRNTAYWQAQLTTNASGNASVDVKLPDNLTTWRMQVRAISGDIQVGEATNEIVSTRPLLLRPALPRFLRVGDEAVLRLLVRNATSQRADVRVSLAAEGVELKGPAEQTASVEPGSSVALQWPASVSREGSAKLTFRGEGGGHTDAVEQTLPIYLDVTPETTATGGVVEDETRSEALYLPPFAITDRGGLNVQVQASATGSLADDLSFFEPQTWEGSERIASRLLSALAVRDVDPEAEGLDIVAPDRLRSDVAALLAAQRQDGGWAWCVQCTTTDPQITGWVLFALGAWQQAGNSLNAGVIERASGYVSAYINRFTDVERPADPNQKAFLLSALAANGSSVATSNLPAMRALVEQSRAELANWGRAYLLLGLSRAGAPADDRDVRRLLEDVSAAVIPSANGNHWEDEPVRGSLQTNPLTTALVLQALTELEPEHPLIEETVRWLVFALGTDVCRTTVERSRAVAALAAFAQRTGELEGDFTYQVRLDGRDLLSGRLRGAANEAAAREVPLSDLQPGATSILSLARDAKKKGRMYYTLDLRYVTPARQVDALNRGIAVSHEYSLLGAPDTPVTSARLGDVVRVKLTVVAPSELSYVSVQDALPAGLEAIDPQLKIVDPALRSRLENERIAAARPAGLDYYAPWFRWYYNPWQQVDLRDDRVVLSTDRLGKGVYEYIYYARATTPGDFYVAPAVAEETYFPEVFGRSDSSRFSVTQ